MSNHVKRFAAVALIAAVAGYAAVPVQAASEKSPHVCVSLQQIDETPVIDDKTILMKMKGGLYKRVDLVTDCSGLKMREGFRHQAHNNDFCSSDTLRVNDTMGATCMVDKIVDINKAEADALLARR